MHPILYSSVSHPYLEVDPLVILFTSCATPSSTGWPLIYLIFTCGSLEMSWKPTESHTALCRKTRPKLSLRSWSCHFSAQFKGCISFTCIPREDIIQTLQSAFFYSFFEPRSLWPYQFICER